MVKTVIISVLVFLYCSGFLTAQEIKEVWSEVKEDKILVHYIITGGSFTDRFNISLYASRDGGKSFEGPLKEVTGDDGRDVQRGARTIVWNALKEHPFTEESMIFEVRGEKQPVKKSFFISYVGNSTTWLGLRAGMLAKIGFYAEIRGNTDAFKKSSFTYRDGSIIDYNQPGYYEFTGKNGYSALSIVGGVNWQVVPDLFIFGGAGFGKENYLLHIDHYAYNQQGTNGQAYAKYDGYCVSGLEIDAGLMYRLKWFLITAGATTINFKSFNWTAGAGVTF